MKLLTILFLFSTMLYANLIQMGIDILENEKFLRLKNKNIALVVNHTSINSKNEHIIDILYRNKINIKKIFSPEHGLKGNYAAGFENIIDSVDYNIEVISLYGNQNKPSPVDLENIDVILFDIQDIGVRFYTYISTMTLVMESAAQNKVDFIILDRPNPSSILGIRGPKLSKRFQSYVGMHQIPIIYDLTMGELARLIIGENWIENADDINIDIMKVLNWERGDRFELKLPPSPNILNTETALIYPGMCFLEGTNISEGRGTQWPFMVFGSPWMDSKAILDELKSDQSIKGLDFREINFTPISSVNSQYPKYSNQQCNGIQILIENIEIINPINFGIKILNYIKKHNDKEFKFLSSNYIDNLYGSDELRKIINNQGDIEQLIELWEKDQKQFNNISLQYRIY